MKLLPDPSPVRVNKSTEYEEYRPVNSEEDNARPANYLSIAPGEHWCIIGSTNSGKTVLTMNGLLSYFKDHFPTHKRYVLDSTDDPDMHQMIPDALIVEGDEVPDLLHSHKHTLVWKPKHSKIPSAYNQWFDMLNDSREPSLVIIDEVASITSRGIPGLEALCKQFRKHGGTVAVESQRLAKVDTDIFSQVTHYVQMFINSEDYDMRKSRQYLSMSKEDRIQPLSEYGFFYRNTRKREGYKEYADYRQFFMK